MTRKFLPRACNSYTYLLWVTEEYRIFSKCMNEWKVQELAPFYTIRFAHSFEFDLFTAIFHFINLIHLQY